MLGLLVGIRDWVPRSQLTFTIELVLRNSCSVKRRLQEPLGSGEPEAAGDSQSNASRDESGDEDEDLNIYTEDDGEVALDLNGGGRRRRAGGARVA